VEHLQRADVFILTRTGHGTNLLIVNYLKKKFGAKPAFPSEHVPESLVLPNLGQTYDPEFLRGKRVVGSQESQKPEGFRDTLINVGAEIVLFKRF